MNEENFKSAKDVMLPKVVFVDGLATAKEAVELMRKEKVDALFVKKRSDKDAFGIVVVADFIREVIIPNRKFEDVNVYEIMTKPVISVPATMNIRYVPRLLMKANIRIAPVEQNGEYLGVVSLSSLIIEKLDI